MTTPQIVPDQGLQSSSKERIALAPSMVEAVSSAHAFALSPTPVILFGETGSGKTFFAQYIHDLSGRSGGFHDFGMGTIAPQLALDELFGHVRGAFTDARGNRPGQIATVGTGTLLLDDLHTAELGIQKQLLQVLDRGTYKAVGSDRIQTAACRFLFAMTEHPDTLMARGQLLPDLRYRFCECAIEIPPLRERRAEIGLHARRALRYWAEQTRLDGPDGFSDAALAFLEAGEYKGNVRQLEGIVLSAFLWARHQGASRIEVEHLPSKLKPCPEYRRHGDPDANRVAVARALHMTSGNVAEAARLLRVSRSTVMAARRSLLNEGMAERPGSHGGVADR
ncbi:MAG: sigma-54-dependent transcriptional regulator [Gammaproteobacteria bacterium]